MSILVTTASCAGSPAKIVAHPTDASRSQASVPVAALPQMNGPYKVVAGDPGTPPVTWIFTSCGDGCAQVEMGGEGSGRRTMARYTDMNWTIEIHSTRALQCGDGTFLPGTTHYSWNPDTLQGRSWSTSDNTRPCGYEQSLDTDPVPLTLTWAGPPRARA